MSDEISTTEPTKGQLSHFIEVFVKLDGFEAQSRSVRGWGAFDESEVPNADVQAVMAWLREKAA